VRTREIEVQAVHVEPRNPVMALSGEIDMATADQVAVLLTPLIEAGGPVAIDVSDVTFMDSTGIHMLTQAADELADNGCIIVHGIHGAVRDVIEIVQLRSVRQNLHIIECTVLAA
jgi:anti-sigma B factor antagonist